MALYAMLDRVWLEGEIARTQVMRAKCRDEDDPVAYSYWNGRLTCLSEVQRQLVPLSEEVT